MIQKFICSLNKKHGIVVFALALLCGCAGQGVRMENDELYYRLGARRELGRLTGDMVDTWASDTRLSGGHSLAARLQSHDREVVKRSLFQFLCWLTQGPCAQNSARFPEGLESTALSNLEWYFLLDGVAKVLIRHNVPERELNEFLALSYDLRAKLVR